MVRSTEEVAARRERTVAVVVPAYQEEGRVEATLGSIPGFVDHVVVVDDGSTDATYACAAAVERREERVEVVRFARNRGVGRAIVRGYRQALERGAEVVAVMAGDGQMDPADLARVVEPVCERRADYAKGNRLAHEEWRSMPPLRRFGTSLLARLTGWIAGFGDLEDAQCGYTAISADLLEKLPLDDIYPNYGYPNDLLIRAGERDATLAQPVVRPVYAGETSGLSIPSVVGPIGGILLRGLLRRLSRAGG